MNPPDDDYVDMSSVNEIGGDARDGSPASGTAAMTQFLSEFRALGSGPAPEPSAALAALLAGATPLTTGGPGRLRRHQVALGSAAAAAAVVVLTGVAAARHDLPAPAQRLVSTVVDRITPFHIVDKPAQPVLPIVPNGSTSPDDPSSGSAHERDDGASATRQPGGDATRPSEGDDSTTTTRSSDEGAGSGPSTSRSPRSDDGVSSGGRADESTVTGQVGEYDDGPARPRARPSPSAIRTHSPIGDD